MYVRMYATNTLRKYIDCIILPLGVGKIIGQTGPWYGNRSKRKTLISNL